MLFDHQMTVCKPAPTLIKIQHLTTATADHQPNEQFRTYYQSAVGSLMYVMLVTRPDLVFAVSVISRYSSKLNDFY